ncbi:hypothetical protein [Gilliamella apis]
MLAQIWLAGEFNLYQYVLNGRKLRWAVEF